MLISPKGIALLNQFEGCKLKAYQDTRGIWTIGYGTTTYPDEKPVLKDHTITMDKAIDYRNHEFSRIAAKITAKLPTKGVTTTQNEFDALIMFAYNVGWPTLLSSTLFKRHIAGKKDEASAQFLLWGNERGKDGKLHHNKGLYARRKTESQVYSTGDYTKIEASNT